MLDAESPVTSVGLLKLVGSVANEEAWQRFVESYRPFLLRRCREVGLQEADAAEVCDGVLAKLVRTLATFRYDPACHFRGWLTTVVRNAARNFVRDRQRCPGAVGNGGSAEADRLQRLAAPDFLGPEADELEANFQARMRLAWRVLSRVRDRIEPTTWEAFQRTALAGQSGKQVAAELGIPVSTVYVYKSRVAQMLRQEGERLREQLRLGQETES